mmetsp:Transcript_18924/g.17163  ORF Transcript_18924/g.17163 Transcript_18924/m.17163 type:complete len:461 (-) Transcript_18924:52-1434(-)
MPHYWVKVGNEQEVEIECNDTDNVNKLKKNIKEELHPKFENFPVDEIIVKKQNGEVLSPKTKISEVAVANSDETYFFVDAPTAPASQDPYIADVHFKKKKLTGCTFKDYDELLSIIHNKWSIFKFNDFKIMWEYKKNLLISIVSPLPSNFPRGIENKLVIILKSTGFADVKPEDTLSYINSLFIDIKSLMDSRNNSEFPKLNDELNTDLERIRDRIVDELLARISVINRVYQSELTMREFISPLLVGVAQLAKLYMFSKNINGKLSLCLEKNVIGMLAHGPVDYTFLFECIDIVLTEAKKKDIEEGLAQNLLQQISSLEFLTNTLLKNITGESRKRKYSDLLQEISRSIPTYGIVSTGEVWAFTKCVRDSDTDTTIIFISEDIKLNFDDLERLPNSVKDILSIITRMVISQIETYYKSNLYKTLKGTSDLQNVELQIAQDFDDFNANNKNDEEIDSEDDN